MTEIPTQRVPLETTEDHVRRVVEAVRSEPADAVVMVVGHSDTIGPIVEGLGGGRVAPIGPDEFDRLFVLFLEPSGPATLLGLRY